MPHVSRPLSRLALLSLILTACATTGQPTTPTPPPTPTPTPTPTPVQNNVLGSGRVEMTGTVRVFNAGDLLAGSVVTADQVPGQALTDAAGHFTLKLNPGTYDLTFRKSGYGVARLEGFVVGDQGGNVPLNIIQQKNIHGLPETPVKLQVTLKDPETKAALMQVKPEQGFLVDATIATGSPLIAPTRFYVGVGPSRPGSASYGARLVLQNDPQNTTWTVQDAHAEGAVLRGERGQTVTQIVAYDVAGNVTQRVLPLDIAADQTVNDTPVPAIKSSSATAVTLSRSLGYLNVDSGTSSLWTKLEWSTAGSAYGISGFRILRSTDGEHFEVIRTLTADEGTADHVHYSIRDGGTGIQAGQKLYYAVQAFNGNASVDGPVMSTVPLARFRVQNLSPTDHQNNVSLRPDITFQISDLVGDYRKFNAFVVDYPAQGSGTGLSWNIPGRDFITDQPSDPFAAGLVRTDKQYLIRWNYNGKVPTSNGALQVSHTYKLFLAAAAYAADGSAVSIAQDLFYNFDSTSACNSGGPVCDGELSEFTTGVNP